MAVLAAQPDVWQEASHQGVERGGLKLVLRGFVAAQVRACYGAQRGEMLRHGNDGLAVPTLHHLRIEARRSLQQRQDHLIARLLQEHPRGQPELQGCRHHRQCRAPPAAVQGLEQP
eukprot:scaffold21331_cov117-Isochrysis_galbana.AAC.4